MAYHIEKSPHRKITPPLKPLTTEEFVKIVEQRDTINPLKLIRAKKKKKIKV